MDSTHDQNGSAKETSLGSRGEKSVFLRSHKQKGKKHRRKERKGKRKKREGRMYQEQFYLLEIDLKLKSSILYEGKTEENPLCT